MKVGDRITFPMLKNGNGCLFPASTHDNRDNKLECVIIEGDIVSIDSDMIEISYFCPKCNRNFVTSIISDSIR